MTTIEKGTTLDVVLNHVEDDWRTTAYIDGKLYDGGFRWTTDTTRDHLHTLHGLALVQRRKAGATYEWRLTPAAEVPLGQVPVSALGMTPLAATADDLAEVSKRVAEIASQLAAATVPAPDPHRVDIGDECDLLTLRVGQEELGKRIARRAAYDMGRMVLSALDGWIEGAQANHEALGRRDTDCCSTFHPDDIRNMVNDACRVMGAPEAWRKDEADA